MRNSLSRSDLILVGASLALLVLVVPVPMVQAATAGAPYQLKIVTYSDASLTTRSDRVSPGGSLYVDIVLVDQMGSPITNPEGAQIQVTLTVGGGSLSATTAYITVSSSDTASSFGPLIYTAPAHAGVQHLTAIGTPLGYASNVEVKIHV